jgi:hypothetical protein
MDPSQVWYPEIVHSGTKHKFFIFLRVEGQQNAPKHSQTSFWFQWSRMKASQLWYPEIVHSGANTSFASFYMSKVSEMLWNTPKHHFGSNGVVWFLRKFGTPNSAFRHKTQVFHLLTCRKLAKCSETLPNIMLGPIDKNGCFTTLIPSNSAFGCEHKFYVFLHAEG